jgi:hypothetical protein
MMLTRPQPKRLPSTQLRKVRRKLNNSLARLMASYEKKFADGDKKALAFAIYMSLDRAPKWVKDEWSKALFNGEYRSWDELLGSPIEKGKNFERHKQDIRLREPVWMHIRGLRRTRKSLEGCFAEAAEKFGITAKKAKEYYYERQRFYELI